MKKVFATSFFFLAACSAAATTVSPVEVFFDDEPMIFEVIDGRPTFRRAGDQCYLSKMGGKVVPCETIKTATIRPRKRPCWIERTCVMVFSDVFGRVPRTEGGTDFGSTPYPYPYPYPKPNPVPLPAAWMLSLLALSGMTFLRNLKP